MNKKKGRHKKHSQRGKKRKRTRMEGRKEDRDAGQDKRINTRIKNGGDAVMEGTEEDGRRRKS